MKMVAKALQVGCIGTVKQPPGVWKISEWIPGVWKISEQIPGVGKKLERKFQLCEWERNWNRMSSSCSWNEKGT